LVLGRDAQFGRLYWINVYDPDGSSKIEEKYDLYALPMIYLFDKDKKVVYKDISVVKLGNILK